MRGALTTCLLAVLLSPAAAAGEEFHYVHGGDLKRVVSTDDDKVWTTHTGGVLRWSEDGCNSFSNAQLPTSVTSTLRGLQISSDSQGPFAYCVGEGGVLLFSTDNGQSWSLKPLIRNPLQAPAELWDVYFEDRDHGWVCGFEHTLYETFDGGQTWFDVAPTGHIVADNPEWYQLHALGPGEWIAVADEGWIVHRLPDGTMLQAQLQLPTDCYPPQSSDPPFDLELWGVDFVGDTGLIVGGVGANDGYVFKTVDRGATWALHTACFDHLGGGDQPVPSFYGVDMFGDPNAGIVGGYGSGVYRTGLSNQAISPGNCVGCPPGSLALTQVPNDTDSDPLLQLADDGIKPVQRDLTVSDSNQVAWTAGDFGTLRRSDDQGATWTDMAGLHRGRIAGAEFADRQTGVLLGQSWRAFWTVDGGQTFELEYKPGIPLAPTGSPWFGYFRAGAISPDGSRAVLVGDRGRIAVRDPAGTWTDRSIGAWSDTNTLLAVIASNDVSVILVASLENGLYLSLDGGATFGQAQLQAGGAPVTAELRDMALSHQYVLYLTSDQKVHAAPVSDLFQAVVSVPIVGATGTPRVLGAGAWGDIYVGNHTGQLFHLNTSTLQFLPVTAITPADLGGLVNEIEPVPGSPDWFFGGLQGKVQRFDGNAWTPIKSTIEKRVMGLEFFSENEGFVIGPESSVSSW
jgi:photosystem II stability/assembly factor-like uncharacterized protein